MAVRESKTLIKVQLVMIVIPHQPPFAATQIGNEKPTT